MEALRLRKVKVLLCGPAWIKPHLSVNQVRLLQSPWYLLGHKSTIEPHSVKLWNLICYYFRTFYVLWAPRLWGHIYFNFPGTSHTGSSSRPQMLLKVNWYRTLPICRAFILLSYANMFVWKYILKSALILYFQKLIINEPSLFWNTYVM